MLVCLFLVALAGRGRAVEQVSSATDGMTAGADAHGHRVAWGRVRALRSPSGRAAAAQAFGVHPGVPGTVQAARAWLVRQQHRDGSWGEPSSIATTGLALLALLTRQPDGEPHAVPPPVRIGAAYLVSRQSKSGVFGDLREHARSAAHAIATYALCEAHGLYSELGLGPVIERAVRVIIDGQQAGGGWYDRYGKFEKYPRYARRSSMMSAWQVQALYAAAQCGFADAALTSAMERAIPDFRTVYEEATGRFGAQTRGIGGIGNTGAGAYVFQLMGRGHEAEALAALLALEHAISGRPGSTRWTLDGAFFANQAAFNQGGALWRAWHGQLVEVLLNRFEADGFWPAPPRERGVDSIYTTALCALMLEVHHRYPPLPGPKPNTGPPVWELKTGDAGLLIMGSAYMREREKFLVEPVVAKALHKVERVTAWVDARLVERQLRARAALPHAETAAARLPLPMVTALERAADRLELEVQAWWALKPWAIAMSLYTAEMRRAGAATDFTLMDVIRRSAPLEVEQGFLLEPEAIARLPDALSAEQQRAILQYVIRTGAELPGWMVEAGQAWQAGEISVWQERWSSQREKNPAVRALFDRLTAELAPTVMTALEDRVQAGKRELVVIDCWMLMGERGILERLRAAGHTLNRI